MLAAEELCDALERVGKVGFIQTGERCGWHIHVEGELPGVQVRSRQGPLGQGEGLPVTTRRPYAVIVVSEWHDADEIAAALRDQLERLRRLIEVFPGESAFALAAEHIEAAIGQLDPETYVTG